jgi:hypothetical protein
MTIYSIKKISFLLISIIVLQSAVAQEKTDHWLWKKLYNHSSPFLKNILSHPDTFQYQLIYTRIDRNKKNIPRFKNYYLHTDRNRYFNPASMVKMPLAFLSMQKINELNVNGVNIHTTMFTDSSYEGQSSVTKDSLASDGLPSLAQYIRKIFLISDNDAYNRLYEFVGQETINKKLWQMGYTDSRITRRFVHMTEDQNRHTNQVRFLNNGTTLYVQPPAFNIQPFDFSKKILIGKGHLDWQDHLINEPMDFTTHNCIPLEDLQKILQSVLFPASVSDRKRFNLKNEDMQFLYRYMSEYPRESRFPFYDTTEYYDSYTKFFFFRAGKSSIPSYIRSFNKAGWSYGFLTDVAYIVDFKNNIEFMLSGVIYVNSDGILNDDKYEYEETGYPFFKETGNIIYQYELNRHRKYRPNLEKFKIMYE